MDTVLVKLTILEIPVLENKEVSIPDEVLRLLFLHSDFFLCSASCILAGASNNGLITTKINYHLGL